MLVWANKFQLERDVRSVGFVRELFESVATNLDDIWVAMSETPLSNQHLGAEVSMEIAKAKAAYKSLRALPDEAILDDRNLLNILAAMEEMTEAGNLLLMEVDKHRTMLDCTYSR
jgi:hypothetical protein